MKDWRKSIISADISIVETINVINASSLQIALVCDSKNRLIGTVTDGDIRRAIINQVPFDGPIREIMRSKPKVGFTGQTQEQLLHTMKKEAVNQLPVVDEKGFLVGLELLSDLIKEQIFDNWVVLMAGGLGTRLQPLTDNCPKPMVKVGGKPLLETILESFIDQGFNKFYIAVNHLSDQIEDYFGNGSDRNVQIKYLFESKRMGTAGALSLLDKEPVEPLIVMNGDLLTKVNYKSLLDFHHEHESLATMCVREYSMQIPYGVVKIENSTIKKIDEKPVQKFFVNAGIYVLEPDVIKLIPQDSYYDMTTLFDTVIAKQMDTTVFPIREYWIDIGHYEDFEKANNDYGDTFTGN